MGVGIAREDYDAFCAEHERLRKALTQITKMRVVPDDKINRIILSAAIHVANKALEGQ